MINKLSLLGLIGFLGLLVIPTGEISYAAFLAFFVFFGYIRVIPDELFLSYVKTAAAIAFFLQTTLFCIVYAAVVLLSNPALFTPAFPLTFAISMIVFIITLVYHEIAEQRGDRVGA